MKKIIDGYNIGLDIGTGSVGYSVTDLDGNNIKIKGKNMWGVNLFEGATTAVSTRTARGMRRRYDRRRQRIQLLRQFFIDSGEIDINFFERLDCSYLNESYNDYNLFNELGLNDKFFYSKFKTIYHLRSYLKNCEEKADIRLIYLALHHIVKYRGNFLHEDNPNLSTANSDITDAVLSLFEKINIIFEKQFDDNKVSEFTKILSNKLISKRDKSKLLAEILGNDIPGKNIVYAFIGYSTNFSAIFNPDSDPVKFRITDDEKREEYSGLLDDSASEFLDTLFRLNSSIVLQDILSFDEHSEESTLSDAMINKYNLYGKDLEDLKELYKDYSSAKKTMFGKNATGKVYTQYDIGAGKCNLDDLYSTIKKNFPIDEKVYPFSDDERYLRMKKRIENGDFLEKINSTDNGSIPYQLHLEEMKLIIRNQGKYYPFLIENEDKLTSLVSFRLPYWCGPLNAEKNPEGSRQFAWSIRKDKKQKVYPWNFEEVIDVDRTAEKFITTLTNYCTYLPKEKVLPKNSLLFSEYVLRNEIFSININGKFLDAQTRKDLYEEFCKGKNSMNEKELRRWLSVVERFGGVNVSNEKINGFQGDGKFASNMKSYNDFVKILGSINETNYKDVEKMIYYLTIYNDRKIIRRRLSKEFSYLSKDQINAVANLKYSGWASLSEKLLDGISVEENGRMVTIIDKMRTGKYNFMQIINDKAFKKAIEEESAYNIDDISDHINDIINNLTGSPAIKKGIRQSLLVVRELVSIMGTAPANIFVEFARENRESHRISSRRKKLLEMYEENKSNPDYKDIYNCIRSLEEKDFDDRMIYLYCLQNGKSLYSGKKLDISSLSQTCQVDHILPRCYIKDDSFDNLALVLSSENQRKKDSLLLDESIISSRYVAWNEMKTKGLISEKKFNNLTRTSIVPADAKHFINRQLVETRQITKHVADILKELYAPQGTGIVQIKAGLTSDLRAKFDLCKNRDINDYHHAHDAFLACQLGIYISKCFPSVYKDFDFTTVKHYFAVKNNSGAVKNKYGFVVGRFDDMFIDDNGEVIWDGVENVNRIIKCLDYKDCFISKKTEKQSGKFCKETIYPAGSKEAKIKIKENMPVELYGGHTGGEEAYSVIIEFTKGKKRVKKLVGIPIIVDTQSQTNETAVNDYLAEQGYEDFRILKSNILKYQKVIVDGCEYYISSASEVHNARQLVLPQWAVRVISHPAEGDDKKLIDIYNLLSEKIDRFYPGFSSVNEKMKKSEVRAAFSTLDLNGKSKQIRQILIMLHANPSNANLKDIGMTDREGRKANFNLDIDKTVFINTSPTGIFENSISGEDL